jgi:hypothetical protein
MAILLVLPALDGTIFLTEGLGVLPTVEANFEEPGVIFYLLRGLRTVLPFLATGFYQALAAALASSSAFFFSKAFCLFIFLASAAAFFF